MSTARFNTLQNAAGSKSVPVDTVVDGSAKAWVNFNGTGTVAIRAAFNVSSITDNGVGDYTVNFTTAMADANYSCIGAAAKQSGNAGGTTFIPYDATSARTSSAYRFLTRNSASATAEDPITVEVSVFR